MPETKLRPRQDWQFKYKGFEKTIELKTFVLILLILLTACANPSVISPSPTPINKVSRILTPTPDLNIFIDEKGIPMRLVYAGEFTMGSDSDSITSPAHSVSLDAFYMDTYEVTNARYTDCMTAGACDPPHETRSERSTNLLSQLDRPQFI